MPHYKLTYFKFTGRGELPRLVFKAAGVDFEDDRVAYDEWPNLKTGTPFGQLPVLEIDGKKLWQHVAISRYLAKQFGLAGDDDWEQARVDIVVDSMADWFKPLGEMWMEDRPDRKEEQRRTYFDETLPIFYKNLENFLLENDGGDRFLVGDKLSLADLAFVHNLSYLEFMWIDPEQSLANFPKLKSLRRRIMQVPNIATYLQNRPSNDYPTDFTGFQKPSDI